MSSRRLRRLNEQLRRELSELLRTRVRDPRVGSVTVTGVRVAADLGSARVYVQLTGDEHERSSTLEGLEAAAPFLRGTLGKQLRVRRIPELRFEEDRSLERAQRIDAILDEIASDPPEGPPAGEEG